MFDDEQLGFLAGDEYQRAAAIREEAKQRDQVPEVRDPLVAALGRDMLGGRWTDDNPGSVGK